MIALVILDELIEVNRWSQGEKTHATVICEKQDVTTTNGMWARTVCQDNIQQPVT